MVLNQKTLKPVSSFLVHNKLHWQSPAKQNNVVSSLISRGLIVLNTNTII